MGTTVALKDVITSGNHLNRLLYYKSDFDSNGEVNSVLRKSSALCSNLVS